MWLIRRCLWGPLVLIVALAGCQNKPQATPTPRQESSPAAAQPTTSAVTSTPEVVVIAPGGGGPSPQPGEDASATPAVGEPSATPSEPTVKPPDTQPTPRPTGSPTVQASCLDQAVFVGDVTVPDGTSFRPGEKFEKTWRVQNSGTCDWGNNYMLVNAGGDIMSGALSQPLELIHAGEIGEVSIDLTAPTRGGEQKGLWMLQNASGERFGFGFTGNDLMWVQINVTFVDENGLPTGFQPVPETVGAAPGESMTPTNETDDPDNPDEAPEGEEPTGEGNPADSRFANCRYTQNRAFVDQLLRLINAERGKNSLGPVFIQNQLSAAALEHSADMACSGFVDHNGSDGSTWYDRVRAQGYANPNTARENIYVGQPDFGGDAAGAFDWWIGSQVHKDNILFATVTEVGIGYVYLSGSPQGGYFTLVLARR